MLILTGVYFLFPPTIMLAFMLTCITIAFLDLPFADLIKKLTLAIGGNCGGNYADTFGYKRAYSAV
ncbi:hypothetical protein C7382_12116 [Porphyromonas loveana]|uniref:Uncharacterized protein n=1 Tax=Porphyromonas loveana TaxID=1884669 RepID=A0A2U1F447_9PORP|nr:hypothetical protein C7382_12116 [Porphyromonas loveana]